MTSKPIHWGIIAPGNIAHSFTRALKTVDGAVLHSVCSRAQMRAEAFKREHGFAFAFDSMQDFLNDPKLNVVYIASPHSAHYEQALACLRANKAVVCEKPATLTAQQFSNLMDEAQRRKVFFMEAVWSRFLPTFNTLKHWLESGEIGAVTMVTASFGLERAYDPNHRLYNPALGGGALLDVGIYPLTLADVVCNAAPSSIAATGVLSPEGVDTRVAMSLRYPNSELAALNAAVDTQTDYGAWIYGERGRINLAPPFWCGESIRLFDNHAAQPRLEETTPHAVNGYEYEIQAVHNCLQHGATESEQMPLATTLRMMETMDAVRAQLGVRYQIAGE